MANIQKRSVHCSKCDSETQFLRTLGMTVVGCSHAGGPGDCVISFFDPRLEIAAATPPGATLAAATPNEVTVVVDEITASSELTATQARTCKAILNLFETGSVVGRYGSVTVLAGDTGQLTFGRSQTTLGSGNLALLIERYSTNPAARFGARLSKFLPRLRERDNTLNDDEFLKNVLRASADDLVMRDVQDVFFDDAYWAPAVRASTKSGIKLPLGVAIVYDGHVHGSWRLIRDRVNSAMGTPAQASERVWLREYVRQRREWLATNNNPLLRKTVYRMDAFGRLITLDNWGLSLPLVIQGQEVSMQTMTAPPPDAFDGPQPGTRGLTLESPMLQGLDVRLVQVGLSARGLDVRADAIFGLSSRAAVLAFQELERLPATGTLDMASVARIAAM
jgi:chitosanase